MKNNISISLIMFLLINIFPTTGCSVKREHIKRETNIQKQNEKHSVENISERIKQEKNEERKKMYQETDSIVIEKLKYVRDKKSHIIFNNAAINANSFSYPEKHINTKNLYLESSKFTLKGEFETTNEYIARFKEYTEKLYGKDRKFVVKIKNIETKYDADNSIFTLAAIKPKDFSIGMSKIIIINEYIKHGRFNVTNMFGVHNSGTETTGNAYGIKPLNTIFLEHKKDIYGFVFYLSNVSIDQAKYLRKKDVELFLICTPVLGNYFNERTLIDDDLSGSIPTIDSAHAWYIKLKTTYVSVRHLLICDKSSKQVLAAIDF